VHLRGITLSCISSIPGGSTMKRRQFLQAASIGLTATTVAKPAIAQSMPAFKWRLTSSFSEIS
jgi:hypothetical protein